MLRSPTLLLLLLLVIVPGYPVGIHSISPDRRGRYRGGTGWQLTLVVSSHPPVPCTSPVGYPCKKAGRHRCSTDTPFPSDTSGRMRRRFVHGEKGKCAQTFRGLWVHSGLRAWSASRRDSCLGPTLLYSFDLLTLESRAPVSATLPHEPLRSQR